MSNDATFSKIFTAGSIAFFFAIAFYLSAGCINPSNSELIGNVSNNYDDSIKSLFIREFKNGPYFKKSQANGGIKIDSVIVIPRSITPLPRVAVLYSTNIEDAGAMMMGTGNLELFEILNGSLNSIFKNEFHAILEYQMAFVVTNEFNYLLTQVGYSGGSTGDQDFQVDVYDVSIPVSIRKLKTFNYGYGRLYAKGSSPVAIYNENGFFKIMRANDSVFLNRFELISKPQDLPNHTALLRIEPIGDSGTDGLKAKLISQDGISECKIYHRYDDSSKYKYAELGVGVKLLIDVRVRRSWNSECGIRGWDVEKELFMNAFPYVTSDTASICNVIISNEEIIPIYFK
jgi:hypothetical protein